MTGPARRLPIGAELGGAERGVRVRVWAPTRAKVTLIVEAPAPREVVLGRGLTGHHSGFVPGLAAGALYRFRLDDDPTLYPDPASRFQPEGPTGPSEVIDPDAFPWTDAAWSGIPADKHVLYEMHIGTFTPEGTWAAAMEQLPFLAEVGITTLEVMPVNEFAGHHNWGYDGVCFFAPTHNYGTPDDMRRFVDRAHALGIAVILDVVYNHFGPSGNTMFAWCPYYKSRAGDWGDGLNFDGEGATGVRELVIENAGYWIREFHLDGLRLDATQAIDDSSPEHVIAALCRRAREAAGDRTIFIVGENEPQDTKLVRSFGLDALWNDDFHHSARVAMTGLCEGYLHDHRGTPQELLSAIKRGFLYQGQLYPWQRNPRGTPTRGLARSQFVHFIENHDQVANIGYGERLRDVCAPGTLRAMTALLLLSPELPMLFQGQETGSRRPWRFFVDHVEELRDPIRKGRGEFVKQFKRMATAEAQAGLGDPCGEQTYRDCILDPAERNLDAPWVALHKDLLALRKTDPAFTDSRTDALDGALLSERAFVLRYFQDDPSGDRLLLVNLGTTFAQAVVAEPLIAPPAGNGWRILWSSEDPRYGGHGTPPPFTRDRLAIPGNSAVLLAPDPSVSLRMDPAPLGGDKDPVDP